MQEHPQGKIPGLWVHMFFFFSRNESFEKGEIIQKKREMEIYNGPTTLSLSMGNTFKKSLVVEKDHSSKRINLRFKMSLTNLGLACVHLTLNYIRMDFGR
eukprot:TRINITY_DN16634_c0_g5_i2.p1 TRINITY_DN16634_c0_g5~~TRINITY_DN16634_c0_g5_i2.p1  ORF type:complete len:100 (+),score=11.93 TRINITY_DN16634_c0_g5_i2:355-654(+)